jgi:hypothetical protein
VTRPSVTTMTSRPVEARTTISPLNNDTLTVPGRDGSLNGTVRRFASDCAWVNAAPVNNVNNVNNVNVDHVDHVDNRPTDAV